MSNRNTTSSTFNHQLWRHITVHNLDDATNNYGAWEFSQQGVSRLSWFSCTAYDSAYGWQFLSTEANGEFLQWVDCSAYSNSKDGWALPAKL